MTSLFTTKSPDKILGIQHRSGVGRCQVATRLLAIWNSMEYHGIPWNTARLLDYSTTRAPCTYTCSTRVLNSTRVRTGELRVASWELGVGSSGYSGCQDDDLTCTHTCHCGSANIQNTKHNHRTYCTSTSMAGIGTSTRHVVHVRSTTPMPGPRWYSHWWMDTLHVRPWCDDC